MRSGEVRPGDVRSGEVRPGEVRPGEVRPGRVMPGEVMPDQEEPPGVGEEGEQGGVLGEPGLVYTHLGGGTQDLGPGSSVEKCVG